MDQFKKAAVALYLVDLHGTVTGCISAQNNSAGCNAAPSAAQEHDGVNGS